MKLSAILAPLIAAKVPHDIIMQTVQAWEAEQSDALEKRRASDRDRQAKKRANHVTSRDVTVTGRYTPFPDKEKSPTPPKEINPTREASSLRSDVRPEPQAAPSSPTVIELPAVQNQTVEVTAADVSEWREAFPAVDVPQQLRAIRQWLIANPQKRKTARGMKRFVVSWLSRDQDKGGIRPTGPPQRQESDFARHQRECTEALERKVYGDRRNDQLASNGAAFDLEPGDWRPH